MNSKTKHLDTAIAIFTSTGAKRAKGTTFTLTRTGYRVGTGSRDVSLSDAILQGPRGKNIRIWADKPWATIKQEAQAHAAKVPGATLTIYE